MLRLMSSCGANHSRNGLFKYFPSVLGYMSRYLNEGQVNSLDTLSTRRFSDYLMEDAVLYVHWPFCSKRCTYCNFNKYIQKNVDEERMKNCLQHEFDNVLGKTKIKRIKSIFFGGGTPSLADPKTLGSLIDFVSSKVDVPRDAEITLEVNPTKLESSKLRSFKDAGINRVSLGLQALSNSDLDIFGREHSVKDGLRALEEAKTHFPGKTSIDVIFARPGQTLEQWQHELEQLRPLNDDHLSLYQLTLERGTKLYNLVENNLLKIPCSEIIADMYDLAIQMMRSAGFEHYEISNFARNNGASTHNQAYWNGTQYIGIGPGAHSRLFMQTPDLRITRQGRIQTLEPEAWMREVERYGHATRKIVNQTDVEMYSELLMLGLRTANGILEQSWKDFGATVSLVNLFSKDRQILDLIDGRLLEINERGIRATQSGLKVVDSITPILVNTLLAHG